MLESSPKFSMGAKRKEADKKGPGPADYNAKTLNPGSKFTMLAIREEKVKSGPGPGDYETNSKLVKSSSIVDYK